MLQVSEIGTNKINFNNDKSLNLGEEEEGNPEESLTIKRKESIVKNFRDFEPKEQNILVNKEILFSAFYEEINKYYRSFAPVFSDLDLNYPRSIRKVDRR